MKIHEVFDRKIEELKSDDRVQGILLTGSLARGTETAYSDLDIIVIADFKDVKEEVIDGVPVETHYDTVESVRKWLAVKPESAYLYTYGKVIYDRDNVLQGLINYAKNILESYEITEIRKAYFNHKLKAIAEKLTASLALKDDQKINYLIHNNFNVLVEMVYALNSLPVAPQGLNYEIFHTLNIKPCESWLTDLVNLKGVELGNYVMKMIEEIRFN